MSFYPHLFTDTLLYPFLRMSPRRMALHLFPPGFPGADRHKASASCSAVGDSLEIYVEYWLAEHFPMAVVAGKYPLHIPGVGVFECDLLFAPPPRVPLCPICYVIECKNYRHRLPHYYVTELNYRVSKGDVEGGWLFTTGRLTQRSQRIAGQLKLRVMQFCPLTRSFIQTVP